MANELFLDDLVPDGNPLPGDDPDTAPTIGDPVPSSDPTEPNGTPRD